MNPSTLLKTAADRAPAIAVGAAVKGVELGMTGYSLLSRSAGQLTAIARKGISAGTALLDRGDDPEPAAPRVDPWSGGPLQPVDDLREAAFLTQEDAADVAATESGSLLSHAELPLPDYDHLTLGELRTRIRKLTIAELTQLREYERAHADRLVVLKAFDNRLATLAKQSAAEVPTPAP